jgi:hypothetical protein
MNVMCPVIDKKLDRLQDRQGVKIDVYKFGEVDGIAYIDPWLNVLPYFKPLIDALTAVGYVPGKEFARLLTPMTTNCI